MPSSVAWEKVIQPLITVVIFFAGYLFSRIDHIRERRRSTENIKQMLFEELKANYQKFERLLPSGEKELGDVHFGMFFASISEFDFQVYNAYLNRMDILRPAEVQAIYDTYRFMRKTKDSASDMLNMIARSEQDPSIKMALIGCSQPALAMVHGSLGALIHVLSLFRGGKAFLHERQATSDKSWRTSSELERDMEAMVTYFRLPVTGDGGTQKKDR